jgi:hypothetical protein
MRTSFASRGLKRLQSRPASSFATITLSRIRLDAPFEDMGGVPCRVLRYMKIDHREPEMRGTHRTPQPITARSSTTGFHCGISDFLGASARPSRFQPLARTWAA